MEDEQEGILASGLTKFCATRWTVRATCFQRVIDNYDALLKLWNDCLETRLESDVRGRIIGCQAQMKKLDFFFGLNLSQRIFSHTDNLSETGLTESRHVSHQWTTQCQPDEGCTQEDQKWWLFCNFLSNSASQKTGFYYGACGTKKQKSSWKIWGWNWNAFVSCDSWASISKNLLWSTRFNSVVHWRTFWSAKFQSIFQYEDSSDRRFELARRILTNGLHDRKLCWRRKNWISFFRTRNFDSVDQGCAD